VKLAIGFGEMGDEDLRFESPPTLCERTTRISEEIKQIDNIKNFVETKSVDGVPTTSQLSLDEKNSMKTALLLSIANLSHNLIGDMH
jgi:ribosomal protein S1